MLKDGIVLEYGKNRVIVNQYSFCELIKYILIDYFSICYEEASRLVDTSFISKPIESVLDAALFSHEYTYYWAMLLYYGSNNWGDGIPTQPENILSYFEFEDQLIVKHGLKEPFVWT